MFDADALVRDTFVASVEQHAEIGSTSDRALELCRGALPPLSALILAERQTAGRGRGAAKWWAGEGALTFTLILDPPDHAIADDRMTAVPLAMAAAVADAVREAVGVSPWVKWPNDVYVGDRKLAGVLTESPVSLDGARRLVIGVGLNVNNDSGDAPPELSDRVVSVRDLANRSLAASEQQTLLIGLLESFAARLGRLDEGVDLSGDCPFDGQPVRLVTPMGEARGRYVGVDRDGALLLDAEGRTRRFVSGSTLALDKP